MQSLNFNSVPQAAIHSVRFNNQELRLAWHKPTASFNTTDPDAVEPEDEEVRPSSQFNLRVFGLLCSSHLNYFY